MLFRLLDTLRTKSKTARRRYSFVTAFMLTALIAGIWSLSLPSRFAGGDAPIVAGTAPFAGFFARLWAPFTNIVSEESTAVSGLAEQSHNITNGEMMTQTVVSATSSIGVTVQPNPPTILIGTTSTSFGAED